jgi:hypothetical protein
MIVYSVGRQHGGQDVCVADLQARGLQEFGVAVRGADKSRNAKALAYGNGRWRIHIYMA